MHREHHQWWSWRLNRKMELLVLGHAGAKVLVFPTSQGRFFEWEDRGMAGWDALWRTTSTTAGCNSTAWTALTPKAGTHAGHIPADGHTVITSILNTCCTKSFHL